VPGIPANIGGSETLCGLPAPVKLGRLPAVRGGFVRGFLPVTTWPVCLPQPGAGDLETHRELLHVPPELEDEQEAAEVVRERPEREEEGAAGDHQVTGPLLHVKRSIPRKTKWTRPKVADSMESTISRGWIGCRRRRITKMVIKTT